MAGLLDLLGGNVSEPQRQGLLAAAAQMLQASGPSLRPVGFGQVVGSGVGAYQQAKLEAEQNALASQLRGLQIQGMQGELTDKDQSRKDALSARDWMLKYRSGQTGGAVQMPSPAPAESMFRGAMAGGGESQASSQEPVQSSSTDPFTERMQLATAMRQSGNPMLIAQADKVEEQALKFRDEYSTTPQYDQNGNAFVLSKGGARKVIDGVKARDKMELVNLGGKEVAYNPYQLQSGQSFERTVDPNTVYSGNVTMRGQNMTDARTREQNAISNQANQIKLQEKIDTNNMTRSGQIASFDTMLGTLDRLKSHAGLGRSVGLYSKVPTMPGSDSANFQAELETFKSQAFIPMVAQLKGMGALSDAEGRKLTAAVGALDPTMSESAFKASIDRVVADMQAARQRVAGHGAGAIQPPTARVATLADIAETARKSGRSTAEVTAALRAKGYTIGGQ